MLSLHLKMSHGKTIFKKLVRDTTGKFIQDKIIITTLLSDYMKLV